MLTGKQVYEHYLAIDSTVDVTARNKPAILRGWVEQWADAVRPGPRAATSQPNELVSPLTEPLKQQPNLRLCGYFFRPDRHEGDTAALLRLMHAPGRARVPPRHPTSTPAACASSAGGRRTPRCCPKGTLYMPLDQPLKHWIQAVMGEDPFEPIEFFYDVATWSYPMQRGHRGLRLPPPSRLPARHADDRDRRPGARERRQRREAGAPRSRPTRCRRSRSSTSCSTRASAWPVPRDAFHGRRPARSRRAPRSSTPSSLGSVDLAALAAKRQTPVTGLDGYPVAHHPMVKPKVGVYSQTTAVPDRGAQQPARPELGGPEPWPLRDPGGGRGRRRELLRRPVHADRQGQAAGLRLPATGRTRCFSTVTAELAAGDLISEDYTALLNANQSIPAGAGRLPCRRSSTRAAPTWARWPTARPPRATRASRCSTRSPRRRSTSPARRSRRPARRSRPRTTTASPAAWGFDDGGFIYRDAHRQPDLRPGHDDRQRHHDPAGDGGGRLREPAQEPGLLTLGDERELRIGHGQARRAPGRGRPAVRRRPRGDDRPRRVLPLLEGGRRARRAQRPAVPDHRGPAAGRS